MTFYDILWKPHNMKSFSVVAIIEDGLFKCHICQVSSSVLSEFRWFSKSSSFLWSPHWKPQTALSLCPAMEHACSQCSPWCNWLLSISVPDPNPVLRSCLLQCCFPSAEIFTSRSWSPKSEETRWPLEMADHPSAGNFYTFTHVAMSQNPGP